MADEPHFFERTVSDSLEPGTSISHYRILSRIGAGGMGEVYLAEDTKLGRKIALKLLLSQQSSDYEERLRRFEQEARAASALNHPNIITIHEVGSERGARFIAMEYVEGENLRQRLKHGKLGQPESLDISIQVANALAAAHKAGIVHRDIKPENVMLRPDGYIKVLDFGVVKLTERFAEHLTADHGTADIKTITLVSTEANIVMGSPNYMSPEQARGLPVDGRTDIFSLGALLYEMLTSNMPFDGDTVSDVVVSLLERQPPPIRNVTPEVYPRVEGIVEKALAKDRSARYQTIDELLTDLRRAKRRLDHDAGLDDSMFDSSAEPTAPTRADQDTNATVKNLSRSRQESALEGPRAEQLLRQIKVRTRSLPLVIAVLGALAVAGALLLSRPGSHPVGSIAVLPFVNESGDQNYEYLSDGITESLINNLSRSPRLKVVSRDSSFRYKGSGVSSRTAGRELGVQAVLTGRIVHRGDSLQINVELVDARDDTQVWGEQFNQKMSGLLAAQEAIARSVSDKLELKLGGADQRRVNTQGTGNAEAYKLYLLGRYYWNKRNEDGLRKGVEYFNQAIDLDPLYARAHAGLADCFAMMTEYGAQPATELYPKVKAAARRAIEIDDTLAEAHTSLAAACEYEWNWQEAEDEYRRALDLNSNYATAHQWYGVFLSSRLRHDEALTQLRQALELDPLSLIINTSMGRALYAARQYDKAMEQLRRTVEMDPNFGEARFQLAMVYEQKAMYGEAKAEFEKCVELFGDASMRAWVGRVLAIEGKRREAERVLAEVRDLARAKYVSSYPIATVYAALGDKDRAFELLRKVYDERSYYVVWLNVDPVLDGLRSDPRFVEMIKRIGLAP